MAARRKRKRRSLGALAATSKKDYIAIGDILCQHSVPGRVIDSFADYFQADNPNFKRQAFVGHVLKCQKKW